MIEIGGTIQKAVPKIAVAGSGYTWLRQFGGHVGAGVLQKGLAKIIGFGRQAFAYPNFARDLVGNGEMDKNRVCISCSMCTVIMRDGGKTGCVVRDAKVYGPIFKEGRKGKPSLDPKPPVAEHV